MRWSWIIPLIAAALAIVLMVAIGAADFVGTLGTAVVVVMVAWSVQLFRKTRS
jgi:hypothetical protein